MRSIPKSQIQKFNTPKSCWKTVVLKYIEPSTTETQHTIIMQNAVLENCCAQLHRGNLNRKSTHKNYAKCCVGKLFCSITQSQGHQRINTPNSSKNLSWKTVVNDDMEPNVSENQLIENMQNVVLENCCRVYIEPRATENRHIKIMQNVVLGNCCAQLHRTKHSRKSTQNHAKIYAED